MKWKTIAATVLAILGITAFAKAGDKDALTAEQKENLNKHFGEAFTNEFESHLNDSEGSGSAATENAAQIETLTADLATATLALENAMKSITATEAEKTKLAGQVENLNKMILTLSNESERDPKPIKVGDPNSKWNKDNTYFLGGVNEPMYAIGTERPYNVRAYNAMARNYGGTLIPYKEASSMDYTTLKTDLGEYYRLRKQDQIQSFLVSLPNLEDIFTLESGYQDQSVLVNMFMGEFSQAENTVGSSFSNLVKGTYTFEPEILKMYGVMFAHNFTDLKEMEKNWLGYLNREHSNVIKMSFIQYILVETAKKLHNEKQNRYINGVYIAPTANVAGPALNASNGLREFLRAKIAGFQILPFDLGEWTASTISDHVYRGTGMVPQALRDTGRIILYMSPDALTQYWKNRETIYGLNQDYKPNAMFVPEYPNVKIVTIPGMGASKRLLWTLENNIHTYTDGLGEMLQFNLEQQDWNLKVWSNWKESIWANLVGKKYTSKAAMPTDYSTQMIFCNDVDLPAGTYVDMITNDTSPSVKYHKSLQSVSNSQATAITDIDDAVTGDEIRLKCNSVTNAITIAASGKFSLLTAAWSPSLGDVLVVKKRSDGKFIEVSRSVVTTDAIVIAADDTSPDVADGTEFVTSANTVATAITTLDNASYNTVYTIYGGSATNATTIANSGNFVLTAAMTLGVGVYIKLQKAQNDKFYEIERG
jgi:hypothetical protein